MELEEHSVDNARVKEDFNDWACLLRGLPATFQRLRTMYTIIGADGRPYGPATAEQVRELIASGRANGQTMAQLEGAAESKPLSAFPEFAEALAAKSAAPSSSPAALLPPASEADALANEILARDYELDIFGCLGRAWERMQRDFWPIVGVSAVAILLMSAAGSAGVGIVLLGPLTGGLFYYYLKLIRGQKAEMGDAFAGFSIAFLQLFLGYLVSALLIVVGFVFCVIPGIYFAVAWKFALPLMIDKKMEFWPAMELSRKVITRHWWSFFGLAIMGGLLNIVGMLVCCVGMFVTMPVTLMAIMYAYEDIFGSVSTTKPAQTLKPL